MESADTPTAGERDFIRNRNCADGIGSVDGAKLLNSGEFSYGDGIMEFVAPLSEPESTAGNTVLAFENELPRIKKLTVQASVCLGRQRMMLKDLCQLVPGAMISLQIPCDVPSELVVGDQLLATGEVVRNGVRLGFRLRHLATG